MARWRDILLVLGPRKPIDSHFLTRHRLLHFHHHRIVSPWIHQCHHACHPPLGKSHRRHLGDVVCHAFSSILPCSVYLGCAARRDRGQSYHRPIAFGSWMGKDGIDFVGCKLRQLSCSLMLPLRSCCSRVARRVHVASGISMSTSSRPTALVLSRLGRSPGGVVTARCMPDIAADAAG